MIQTLHEQFVNDDVDMEWEAKDGPMAFSQILVHGSAALAGAMTITLESGDVEYLIHTLTLAGTDGFYQFPSPVLMNRGDKITVAFTNTAATIDVSLRGLDRAGFNY